MRSIPYYNKCNEARCGYRVGALRLRPTWLHSILAPLPNVAPQEKIDSAPSLFNVPLNWLKIAMKSQRPTYLPILGGALKKIARFARYKIPSAPPR